MASSISLLYKRKTPPQIGSLTLDATLTESHEYRSQVTAFPVESGVTISDHIRNEPERISLEGFVTNSPVKSYGTPFKPDMWREQGENRAELAFNELMRIRDDRELVTIVTGLRKYSDMALESIVFPRSNRIGQVLQFTANFVHVVKVSTSLVLVENLSSSNGANDKASSEVKKGTTNTVPKDSGTTERPSTLYKGVMAVMEKVGL